MIPLFSWLAFSLTFLFIGKKIDLLWLLNIILVFVIWQKIVVPSDTHKKNSTNCSIALQYLKNGGVTLHDEDGMRIMEDDVANGDKELTVSLLWNMFVDLQVCGFPFSDI